MDNFRKQRRYTIDGFSPRRPQAALTPRTRDHRIDDKVTARNSKPDGFMRRPDSTMSSFTQPSSSSPKKAPTSSLNNTLPYRYYTSPSSPRTPSEKHSSRRTGRRNKTQAKNTQKKKWKSILKRSSLALIVLILIGGGVFGWKILGNVNKVFHGNIISDAHALLGSSTVLKGESRGRINLLLAGDSVDDPHHGGARLTDSIMIVSINTKKHTGFMLSIPRDLWVDIPGMGHAKINAANTVSGFNQPGYPKGGMGQLEEVIQDDFGIPIDYYALIDYTAFRDAVNAVGGITINIQSPDPRGLYDPNINVTDGGPLKLPNGPVTLDGQEALNLARARGDSPYSYGFPQSDFDRTMHQRQMLTALEQKALSIGVLTNPIKVTQLFDALGNNVHTDLTLSDAMRFVQITKGINVSNMQSLTLKYGGKNALLTSYKAPNGEDALIPMAGLDNFSQIQQYYKQVTSSNPVTVESPSVVILNGSNVTGLARKEDTLLQSKGFNVAAIGNASTQYLKSLIVDMSNGQKPASKKALQAIFASNTSITTNPASSTEASEASGYNADFVVILGQNWDSTASKQ